MPTYHVTIAGDIQCTGDDCKECERNPAGVVALRAPIDKAVAQLVRIYGHAAVQEELEKQRHESTCAVVTASGDCNCRADRPCPKCGETCHYDGWDHVHGNGRGIGSCMGDLSKVRTERDRGGMGERKVVWVGNVAVWIHAHAMDGDLDPDADALFKALETWVKQNG